MVNHLSKSIAFAGFPAMPSLPASAQPSPPPQLPSLEICIGHTAPPRMRLESRLPSPGPDHAWVRGSWDWQRGQWVWIDGRWDRPERTGVQWVAARYARESDAWRYEPALWSHQKIVEGDDHRCWKNDHRKRHEPDNGRDSTLDRDRDRDREHNKK